MARLLPLRRTQHEAKPWNASLTFRKLLASSARMLSPASDTPLKASSNASLVDGVARTPPEPDVGGLEELAGAAGAWFSVAHSCSITASTVLPSLCETIHAVSSSTSLKKGQRPMIQSTLVYWRVYGTRRASPVGARHTLVNKVNSPWE